MIILTNFSVSQVNFNLPNERNIKVIHANDWKELRKHITCADLLVIDCRDFLIYKIVLYLLLRPWMKKKYLVAVDLVLREPHTLKHKLTVRLKRVLLTRINHFIHFFKNISSYTQIYGIREQRSSYVAFKSNIFDKDLSWVTSKEDYIYTMGISLRDYNTFIKAIEELPYPAAISEFSFRNFQASGLSSWTHENIPQNLTILQDTGNSSDLLANMARAKLVVIPTFKSSCCASGISTYLDAMFLEKCVILSDGPGASDVLSDQAIIVPAEEVDALREAIKLAWEDGNLRREIASNGHRYVMSLGGEYDLMRRIFEQAIHARDSKLTNE